MTSSPTTRVTIFPYIRCIMWHLTNVNHHSETRARGRTFPSRTLILESFHPHANSILHIWKQLWPHKCSQTPSWINFRVDSKSTFWLPCWKICFGIICCQTVTVTACWVDFQLGVARSRAGWEGVKSPCGKIKHPNTSWSLNLGNLPGDAHTQMCIFLPRHVESVNVTDLRDMRGHSASFYIQNQMFHYTLLHKTFILTPYTS